MLEGESDAKRALTRDQASVTWSPKFERQNLGDQDKMTLRHLGIKP